MAENTRDGGDPFRAVFEQAALGMAECELDTGRYLRVNDAFRRITSRADDELLGMTFSETTHPDDRRSVSEAFAAAIRGDAATSRVETRLLRADGSFVWVMLTVGAIRVDGRPVSFSVVVDGENLYTNPKGETGYYEYSFVPLFAQDGTVEAVGGRTRNVTERRKAELALGASETKYRTLFGSIDQGFCILEVIFDDDGRCLDYRYLEINPAFERQTGMTDALGRTVRELVPDLEPFWFDIYGEVARTGEPTRFVDHAESMGRWFDVYAFRIGDPEARQVAVLFADITERKRHEVHVAFLAELADDFARLSSADEIMQTVGAKVGTHLDVTTCLFADVDEGRGELTVTYAWETSGVPSLLQTFRIDDYLSDAFARESRAGTTFVVRDTGTDPRTVALRYSAIEVAAFVSVPFHRAGEWTSFLAVTDSRPRDWRPDEIELIEEVSNRIFPRLERARAEEALRESEARLKRAISIDTVGVVFFDLDGRITEANGAFARMSGYSREELGTTVTWEELTRPEYLDAARHAARELAEQGETAPYEKELVRKDGSRWWGLAAPTRLAARGGDATCVEFIVDISERKWAEADRERLHARESELRAAAEAASRAKDEFLATVSHELRTPLNSMLGWSRLLAGGQLGPAEAESAIASIARNASAQARLIEDLLDVSRIVAGTLRIEREPVDLGELAARIVGSELPRAGSAGVRLEMEPALRRIVVDGDVERLEQVVANLVSNAVKFTPAGGLVSVRVDDEDARAVLTVSDTGRGIAAEFLPYVFDRFRQADGSTTRAHGGLGLGLAIVRRLVELHGGEVEASSPGEGLGATFRVRLPLVAVDRATVGGAARDERPPSLHGVRVLVVDDESDSRELERVVLERCGAEVRTAASVAEALAEIDAWVPDVLLSDVGMPGDDGYALVARVRASAREPVRRIPAVAVTAYATAADRQRLVDAGYQLHLAKPIDARALTGAVADLARSRARE